MTLTHEQAIDKLKAAQIDALTRERIWRFDRLDKRTVTLPLTPELRLLVQARYTDKKEFYALCGTLRYGKGFIAYAAVSTHTITPVGLTHDEALALLETHELPAGKTRKLAPVVEDAAFWDSLNRPDRHDNGGFAAARSLGARTPSSARLLPVKEKAL